ncbi:MULTISPECIES: ribosome hibernation-promoting factor, HPF/YfiA family [Niveibacterium]|uniref:Ribosome hibernation promoting factor n=2 Tax=Niveibacterium TaxID=1769726 RepID=A0A840BQU8_9RHOO|nr:MULTISPECIES: ribosome-associated translation inhibitor RaiA [Niveibacterium]MBB4013839.1 putative sigma-54 modulation protein [Niveibacterium umoris]QSI77203.1 ribosome-associated translation inhibitor RaiA [Niveibacterium microcysteis]
MNLNITGHHLEVTAALRDYVTSKLDRVIRHFDHVTSVNVILSVEKLKQKAEVTVHVRGKDIFVESIDEDLYAAIDAMTDKLDRQVLKHKEKSYDHGHEAHKRQSAES